MLVGGQLIGFQSESAPPHGISSGLNSVSLHFGIDLAKPNDYIRRMMPEWEEPPGHMDLISIRR